MKARTPQEILDSLLAEKTTRTELDVLNNPSNASIWYNLLGVFSVEGFIIESLMEQQLNDVNSRAKEIPVGTLLWYAVETLNYQYGDSLEVIDGIPTYSFVDISKRVVKQSACTQQSGTLIIKAGKTDVNGDTIPLSASELSGLQQYWIEKRFAGVNLNVISVDADLIKAFVNIEIDGQILSLTGESLSNTGEFPVIDAIKEYYKNIDFGGRFTVLEFIDAIQSVNGVKNVVVTEMKAQANVSTSWTDILITHEKSYISFAGYLKQDPANTLDNTLTYYI